MLVQQEALSDPNARSAIITGGNVGLAPYTVYTCHVAGFGDSGQGVTAPVTGTSAQNRETNMVAMMYMRHACLGTCFDK